jgi:5-formyltetrahydrofolate cyclo-ligase
MVGKSFKMVSYRLPLKKKKFGIYEAGNSYKIIKNLDLAIVPIVGIDKDFKRVGFGKGMYDRFFDSLDKKPYIIFVQLKLCKTSKSVCDSYDIQGDMLITSEVWLEKRR